MNLKKILNIGIDIDGCLNNHHKNLYNYIINNYNIKIDLFQYDNIQLLLDKIGLKNLTELYKNIPTKIDIPEFLSSYFVNKLYNKHNVYILTARSYAGANETVQWLNKYNFNYKDIFFKCGNKVDICYYKNIDYMIDDSPYNIYYLIKNNINTIVFSRPYNKKFCSDKFYDNIYIAKNWIEIYNYINSLK